MAADEPNSTNAHNALPALLTSADEFLSNDFDFVIVGGGTAGLAIAARLSENPDVTVGVLEAGKSRLDDPLVDTPAMFLQLLGNPEYDYRFKSEPQVCTSRLPCRKARELTGYLL